MAALSNYNEIGQVNENTSYSIYTQWSWDASDNLELTGGLRYGYEERDMKTQRTLALPAHLAYAGIPRAIPIPSGGVALMTFDTFFNNALLALPLPLGERESALNRMMILIASPR